MSVQPKKALTPIDTQQSKTIQAPNRKTKDILASIRTRLIDKYGNDDLILKCIDSCMKNIADKEKKIKIEDFAVLECKLKKQIEAVKTARKTLRNKDRAKEIRHITNIQHLGMGGLSYQSPRNLEKLKMEEAAEQLLDVNTEKRYGAKQFEAL